jgi:hypothetical protein
LRVKERALLRFDTIVAICALLASSVAAGAMVYQTRVIEEQFSATVWPYLSVDVDNFESSVTIRLTNDGAGPALIRSARLLVDGKAVSGWNDLIALVVNDRSLQGKGRSSIQSSSIDASTAIRSGESKSLFSMQATNAQIIAAAKAHRVGLEFCYCSINNRCWQLSDTIGSKTPQLPRPVNACRLESSIAAEPLKIPKR